MSRKVLIVDDVSINRSILKKIIGTEFETVEAPDGKKALEILMKDSKAVCAVLLDLFMPVMDGLEFLKVLRARAEFQEIPVLVVTGSSDESYRVESISLGANDFISKPFNPDIVRHSLHNAISLYDASVKAEALQKDKLTGLYSRAAFFEKAEALVKAGGEGFYVMACFDINNFKLINDQYGQEEGDRILKFIGKIVQGYMKEAGGIGCRISADNFAALYPVRSVKGDFIQNIMDLPETPAILRAPAAISIGRYVITDMTLTASAIYDRAYLAKNSIKRRYDVNIAYFDEAMRTKLIREQEIIADMDVALKTRQFEVWFQPQFNHASGKIIGSEALVRWRHPEKGLVSPGFFVPVFEQNGFIYELDKYVWEETCRMLRKWLDEGRSPMPVSVNISRYDVIRSDLIEVIMGLLAKYNLGVGLLRLEITESAFSESTDHIVKIAKDLVNLGFTLEIDDFGSGYSSLNTLKDVPAQVVKLDMRFLDDDGGSQRGGNILESVVRMAKWLGMSVIAEGVETRRQADYLKSIGCYYVQGYLYAKPMPAAEYEALADRSRKEYQLLSMETVEHMDNNSFWDPNSMDTLIFNSYVGAACIFEKNSERIEVLRVNDKYVKEIDPVHCNLEMVLKASFEDSILDSNRKKMSDSLDYAISSHNEVAVEATFNNLVPGQGEINLMLWMRVIAQASDRFLFYCAVSNITEKRRSELKEKLATEQLQVIMKDVGVGITATVMKDEKFEFLLTNDKFYEIFGFTRSQYSEEVSDMFDLIHPDDVAHIREVATKAFVSGKTEQLEYRAICRDRTQIWVRVTISRTYLTGVSSPVQLGIFSDITAVKEDEQELVETDEQLQFLNDSAHGLLAQPDCEKAIRQTLAKLMDYFKGDRGYVFEYDFSKSTADNTYEVCSEGVEPQMDKLKDVPFSILSFWLHAFDNRRFVKIDDVGGLEDGRHAEKVILESQKIKSLVAVPLMRDGVMFGFLGVDNPRQKGLRIDRMVALGDYIAVMLTRRDLDRKINSDNISLRTLMNDIPGGFCRMRVEPDGSVIPVYFNDGLLKLVGMDYGQMMDIYAHDAYSGVHPDDLGIVREAVDRMLTTGKANSRPYRLGHYQGGYVWVMIFGRATRDKNGDTFLNIYYSDIADQRHDEMMQKTLLDNLPCGAGICDITPDDVIRLTFMNKSLVSYFPGLHSDSDKHRKNILDEIHPDDLVEFKRLMKEAIAQGSGTTCILRVRNNDTYRTFRFNAAVVRKVDENSKIYVTFSPLTGQELAGQDKLEKGTSYTEMIPVALKTVLASQSEYCFVKDSSLRYICCSHALAALIGLADPGEIAGKTDSDLFGKEIAETYQAEDLGILKDGVPIVDSEQTFISKTGKPIYVLTSKYPMHDAEGKTNGLYGYSRDVSSYLNALEQLRISEEGNKLALRHSGIVIGKFDVAERSVTLLPEVAAAYSLPVTIFGLPRSQVEAGLVSTETSQAYIDFFERIVQGKPEGYAVFKEKYLNTWRWTGARYSTIFSNDGKPVSAIISYADVSDRLEKEAVFRKWQQSLRGRDETTYTLFRCNISRKTELKAQEGSLLSVDFEGGLLSFDERTEEFARKCVCEKDRARFISSVSSDLLLVNFHRGRRSDTVDFRDKSERWLRLTIDLLEYPSSLEIEAYLLIEDIDEEKRAELSTIRMAQTDPLTGVLNRVTFATLVNKLIQESPRSSQHAMLMLDIDGFKQVNDVFGHGVGDKALIDVATTLRKCLGEDEMIGRLGGDEFMFFIPDAGGETPVSSKARRMCTLVRKSFSVEVEISASIGIALSPRDGTTFEELYKKVDAALYYVKGSGKDNFAFFHEDMSDEHLKLKPEAGDTSRKRRMLIVDDSRIDFAMMAKLFEKEFTIEKAKDGNTALIRLRHYGSAISVVLLDLVMPGMDGFAVLSKMQASSDLRNIPVIVVSSSDDRKTSLKAISMGASDFVTKPVDAELLKIRVRSAVSKAENERLRAANSFLEFQNAEVARYKSVLDRKGIIVIEVSCPRGPFIYDFSIAEHLSGTYDNRPFWDILLSDGVGREDDVKQLKELFETAAGSQARDLFQMNIKLKTPAGDFHSFHVEMFHQQNESDGTEKVLLTLRDMDQIVII